MSTSSTTMSFTKSSTIHRKRRVGQARIAALSLSAVGAIYGALSGRAIATTNNPIIGLTGWNEDLIAETPFSSSTTAPFDTYNGQNYFINGLVANGVNSLPYGNGVPTSGTLVSQSGASTTFQFQSYTANNALFLSPTSNTNTTGEVTSSATLNFATAATVSSLAFLDASTNGSQTISYTLNYTDGTTGTGTFSAPDWFSGTPYAASGLGRTGARQVNSTGPVTIDTAQSNSSSGNPRLYEFDVPTATLTANATKYLASITFTSPTTNTNATAIYAVSGVTGSTFTANPLTFTGAVNGNFDTTTANFASGSGATTFSNGAGPVTFDDTSNQSLVNQNNPNGPATTLTIPASGVAPAGVVFNNTYGNPTSVGYQISGGAIYGPGGLTVTNSGTVEISNVNTYVGTTNVSGGGYLIIDSGASIASKTVIVGANSTLYLNPGAQPPSVGTFGLTDNGTVTLNNATRTLGYLNGNGVLNLAGVGVLTTIGGQLGNGSSFGGTITGFGNLVFNSPLALTGASTFTGTSTMGVQAAVLLGSPTALGVATNTMIFAGTTANNYTVGGFGGTVPLTAATNGALPYNYSFAAGTTVFGFSGSNPVELAGNATNWNSSGITLYNYAIPTAPLTISGQIGVGGGGLTMVGSYSGGTLILNNTAGTNALTGTLTATLGAIQLNGANETGTEAAYSVASGGTILINDNSGLAGKVGGNASAGVITATINGNGAPFAFPDAVTGITTAKEFGALRGPDGGSATWVGNVSAASATAITGGVGGTFTVAGVITGSGQIQFSENTNSTTILKGVNTYTGETAVNGSGGKLVLGVQNAITTSGDLNLDLSSNGSNGTTFDMNGFNASFGYLTTTSAVTTGDKITNNGTTPSQLKINTSGGTFAGTIQETPTGQISVYFNGTGTQTLGPANNYSGGTTMNNSGTLLGGTSGSFGSGTITINGAGYLGSNSPTGITVSNPIAYNPTYGIQLNVSNPITVTQAISISGLAPFKTVGTDTTGSHGVFSGTIGGTGTANITGTLVFSGSNTYSGGTNLSSGSLGITNDHAVGTGPVNFLGGALSFVGYTSNLNFTNNGSIAPTLGASTGTPSTLSGNIGGTSGFLFVGPGTLVLNGTNTYTGATNVSGGLLGFSSSTEVPTGVINLIGGGLQEPAGVAVDFTVGRTLNFNSAGGKIDTNGNNVTFAGSINNTSTGGAFTKLGTGSLTLSQPLKVSTLYLQTGTVASPSTLILSSSTPLVTDTGGVDIGEVSGDVGQLNMSGGAKIVAAGDINIADQVSAGTGAVSDIGILNLSDASSQGTTLIGANLYVGKGTGGVNAAGTVNQTGGLVQINSSTGNLYVGQNGVGTYNLSGGQVTAAIVTIAKTNTSTGTFNLNGGNLLATQIIPGVATGSTGISNFNFNGGTLTANASSTSFFSGLTSTVIGTGGAIINTNGFSDTIAQNISSGIASPGTDGGLTKNGLGTLTLSGTNTFTGNIVVNGGTLSGTSTGAFGNGTTITLNNSILALSADTNKTIIFNGSSGLQFNNYSSTSINLSGSNVITLGAIGTSTFAGNISGSALVNYIGPGSLTLLGNDSYTGGTNLSAGTLVINNDSALGTGPVTFVGGALGFNGYTSNLSFVTTPAAPVALGSANGSTSTLTGGISGTGGLTYVGPGLLVLTGTNTYTGPTNISGGLLSFNPGSLPVGTVNLTGGGIQFEPGVTTDLSSGGRTLVVAAGGGSINTNGNSINLAAPVTNSASGSFVKLGSGALTFGVPVTVSNFFIEGGTSASPSTVALSGIANAINTSAGVAVGELAGDYAILSLDNGAKMNVTGALRVGDTSSTGVSDIGLLTIADAGNLGTSVTTATLSVGSANGAAGTINLSGGAFKTTSTAYLGNNGTGVFNATGGTSSITSTMYIGYGANTGSGVYNNFAGATFNMSGTTYAGYNGVGVFNMAGGVANITGSMYATGGTGVGYINQSGGVISSTGSLYIGSGAKGYLNLTGGVYNTSGTSYLGYIQTGVVTVAGGTFNSTGTVYLGFDPSATLNISSGSFSTTGTMYVNDFDSGVTDVINVTGGNFSAGTLNLSYGGSGNATATFNLSNATAVISNLYLAPSATAQAGIFNLNPGGTLYAGTISTNGETGYTGTNGAYFNFNGGTLKANASSSTFSGAIVTTIGAAGAIIDTNGNSLIFSSNISSGVTGSPDGGLTKNGLGVLTLSGTNTYTGVTNINAGGVIGLGTQPFGTPGNVVNINTGATIGLTSDNSLNTLSSEYTININGGGYLFVNYNSSLSFNTPILLGAAAGTPSGLYGTIYGTGSLTYVGPGTLNLYSDNSYTGGTNIAGGTLAISDDGMVNNIAPTFTGGFLQLVNYSSGLMFTTGPVNLSVPTGGTSSLTSGLGGNAALNFAGPGQLVLTATGTNTGLTTLSGGTLNYSSGSLGTGGINLSGGTLLYASGTTDDLTSGRTLTLAAGASTINLNGNTVNYSGNIAGANLGSLTVTGGGSLTLDGSLSPTSASVAGGSSATPTVLAFTGPGAVFNQSAATNFTVGVASGDNAILNVNSGASVNTSTVQLAVASGSTGTLNLNGGTLKTSGVVGGSGTSTLNFNGGTLLANASSTSFVSSVSTVAIQAGPAVINTNGFNVSIGSPIVTGSTSPDGGLVKNGLGTLTLNGTNTYNGGTTVNAGSISALGVKNLGTGPITVNNTGTLTVAPSALNSGTQPITLSGGTLSLSGTATVTQTGFGAFPTTFNTVGPNGGTAFTPTNTGTTLNLTSLGTFNYASSVYTPFTINDAAVFTMTFTYSHNTATGSSTYADGISFGFQNDSRGASAIGGVGGGQGYSNANSGVMVTPSEVGYFDLYGENYGLGKNGVLTSTSTSTSVSANNNELITVTYNGPTKTFTSSLNYGSGTLTSTSTGIDLVSQLGGTAGGSISAYLGFAGATGGVSATQSVSNLAYSVTGPAAANLSNPITLTPSTSSTILLAVATGATNSSIGTLTFGSGSTLNVNASGTASTYSLTTGTVMLSGTNIIDVASPTGITGSVYLGALNDGGVPATLITKDAGTVVLNATAASFGSGSAVTVSTGSSLGVTAAGALGSGTLNVSGKATFNANNTGSGAFVQTMGQLNVLSGGIVKLAPATPQSTRTLLSVTGLSIAGTLDMANDDMVVAGGSLSTINGYVKQGYANGSWNGPGGITSSTAAADLTHLTAVGVILNDDGTGTGTALKSTFDGVSVNDSSVLLKYTYYGDTDLSGVVDGSDYSRIDNAYETNTLAGSNVLTGWFNGDFNYDGVIDGSDYTLIDNAYNSQGASLNAQVATPSAQISGSSAVPEPTSFAVVGMTAAGLLGRRRRRN